MYVDHLQLVDFRNYAQVDVALGPGVTILMGANGQGKTNLVEAVDYLASLGSHRVAADAPLVRAGAEQAIVRARVRAGADDERVVVLEIEITPGRANRARLNRGALSRPREILGILRTVLFSPEDLALVKGDPGQRRAFLDDLVVTRWPRFAGVRSDYDRILRQRNSLLKTLSGRARGRHGPDPYAESTLEVWDEQLAGVGGELLFARLNTLAAVLPHVAQSYADIAPANNEALASYRTGLTEHGGLPPVSLTDPPSKDELVAALRASMLQRRRDEIVRGVGLVGPHRDDVVLSLGALPAKGYASHGESWSFALALKLGAFHLLQSDGVEPVLILDDVFAELDSVRRQRLAESVVVAEQLLVTAAVGADVPEVLQGTRYVVRDGTISQSSESTSSESAHKDSPRPDDQH